MEARDGDCTDVCREVSPGFLNKVTGDQLRLEGSTLVLVIKVGAVIQKDPEPKPFPLEGRHLVVLPGNYTYSMKAEHPHLPYPFLSITLNLRKHLFVCVHLYTNR